MSICTQVFKSADETFPDKCLNHHDISHCVGFNFRPSNKWHTVHSATPTFEIIIHSMSRGICIFSFLRFDRSYLDRLSLRCSSPCWASFERHVSRVIDLTNFSERSLKGFNLKTAIVRRINLSAN